MAADCWEKNGVCLSDVLGMIVNVVGGFLTEYFHIFFEVRILFLTLFERKMFFLTTFLYGQFLKRWLTKYYLQNNIFPIQIELTRNESDIIYVRTHNFIIFVTAESTRSCKLKFIAALPSRAILVIEVSRIFSRVAALMTFSSTRLIRAHNQIDI